MTDQQLIKACIAGKAKSQRALFDKYSYPLMQVSMRYSATKADAEDVLQEAWIKIFNALKNYQEQGKFLAWMKMIVIRVALRKKEKASFKNEKAGLSDIVHPKLDPSMIEDMTANEILGYVLNLPKGYQEVFKLFVIDGLSHKEIGELLNIEASTSRAKLTTARRKMQQTIINANKIYAHES